MSESEQSADPWKSAAAGAPWTDTAQGPAQTPPGYGYPPPAMPYYYVPYPIRRTNGFSIAALVCGLCGFVYFVPAILGIIFGLIAIRQTRRDGTDGVGMAIAGLVTGICWLLLLGLIIILVLR